MQPCILILFAALLLGACTQPKTSPPKAEAQAMQQSVAAPTPSLAATPKLLVLDVRTPEEYNSGHVEGAVNIPLNELPLRIGQVAPDKATRLAVHCQSGGRSARAKKLLDSQGYTQVEDLGSLAHAREVIEGKQP